MKKFTSWYNLNVVEPAEGLLKKNAEMKICLKIKCAQPNPTFAG